MKFKEVNVMKTVRLEIGDNIYEKVMHFLSGLPKNDIHVSLENTEVQHYNAFRAVSLKTKDFKFSREEANER